MKTVLILILIFLTLDFIDKELIKDKSKIIWLVLLLGALVIFIVTIDIDNELLGLALAVIFGYSAVALFYKSKKNSTDE